jgi:hypothetical protein
VVEGFCVLEIKDSQCFYVLESKDSIKPKAFKRGSRFLIGLN